MGGNIPQVIKVLFIHQPMHIKIYINPLNPELNPICHLLALLLGALHIFHVSDLRVNLHFDVNFNIVFLRLLTSASVGE